MTWKIHLSSLLIILLVSSLTCIPTLEAFEVQEYDGMCTESAGNHCDADDNKSIQVNSTYGIISSLGKTIYNSVLNFSFMSGLKNVKEKLDDPSKIVWMFWDTVLDTLEEYFPQVLSLLFFILAAVVNMLMWYIRVPLLHILWSDATLLLIYSFVGPKLVIEYFPGFCP